MVDDVSTHPRRRRVAVALNGLVLNHRGDRDLMLSQHAGDLRQRAGMIVDDESLAREGLLMREKGLPELPQPERVVLQGELLTRS